jgi:hypothetical protein
MAGQRRRPAVYVFKVVKERFGWAVYFGDGVSTPFWSQALAVREANRLCAALRRHGVAADVIIEEEVITAARISDAGGSPRRDPVEASYHAAWR